MIAEAPPIALAIAIEQPAINSARATRIALLKQAIVALKSALVGYEIELSRLEALP